jgi:hypothetical protein
MLLAEGTLSIPEARKPSVSIMPGSIEFTQILLGPNSWFDITRMRKRPKHLLSFLTTARRSP